MNGVDRHHRRLHQPAPVAGKIGCSYPISLSVHRRPSASQEGERRKISARPTRPPVPSAHLKAHHVSFFEDREHKEKKTASPVRDKAFHTHHFETELAAHWDGVGSGKFVKNDKHASPKTQILTTVEIPVEKDYRIDDFEDEEMLWEWESEESDVFTGGKRKLSPNKEKKVSKVPLRHKKSPAKSVAAISKRTESIAYFGRRGREYSRRQEDHVKDIMDGMVPKYRRFSQAPVDYSEDLTSELACREEEQDLHRKTERELDQQNMDYMMSELEFRETEHRRMCSKDQRRFEIVDREFFE